jgi:hypothetical protein
MRGRSLCAPAFAPVDAIFAIVDRGDRDGARKNQLGEIVNGIDLAQLSAHGHAVAGIPRSGGVHRKAIRSRQEDLNVTTTIHRLARSIQANGILVRTACGGILIRGLRCRAAARRRADKAERNRRNPVHVHECRNGPWRDTRTLPKNFRGRRHEQRDHQGSQNRQDK